MNCCLVAMGMALRRRLQVVCVLEAHQCTHSLTHSSCFPGSATLSTALPRPPPIKFSYSSIRELARKRKPIQLPSPLLQEVSQEIEFYDKYLLKLSQRKELEAKSRESGSIFECGCCYGDFLFEDLVQCMEGHLFCCQCLVGYAKEATFGEGRVNVHDT
eukprot:m.171070 g.171070  ORF g.171070 m.171070 type:complete len:159 (+) comp39052_c0_seq9:722-1198(+)